MATREEIRPGDVVLLKASRGVRLERALESWMGRERTRLNNSF